jgi:hypothetical protein
LKTEEIGAGAISRSPTGTTVADSTGLWRHRGCYGPLKVGIAPKGAIKGIEVLSLRGSASGTNARVGVFGGFERSERERNCPGDGLNDRDFSLVRMEPIRRLHRRDAQGAEPRPFY